MFCGLGIHNVLNYEQKCKALAHYSVALEVSLISGQVIYVVMTITQQMSYHATATSEETERLQVVHYVML